MARLCRVENIHIVLMKTKSIDTMFKENLGLSTLDDKYECCLLSLKPNTQVHRLRLLAGNQNQTCNKSHLHRESISAVSLSETSIIEAIISSVTQQKRCRKENQRRTILDYTRSPKSPNNPVWLHRPLLTIEVGLIEFGTSTRPTVSTTP